MPLSTSAKQVLATCPVRAGELKQEARRRTGGWAGRTNGGEGKEREGWQAETVREKEDEQ